ncbi:MAG: hypothetical protein QM831_45295 [Kofleriaceae bacterium]
MKRIALVLALVACGDRHASEREKLAQARSLVESAKQREADFEGLLSQIDHAIATASPNDPKLDELRKLRTGAVEQVDAAKAKQARYERELEALEKH